MTTNFRHRETLLLLLLLLLLTSSTNVNAASDPNSDYPNPPVRASPYIGIIFLLFTALIIFTAIFYYYLRERCLVRRSNLLLRLAAASAHSGGGPGSEGGGRGGLDPAVVKSFPELPYSEAKLKYVNAGPDCAVCLSSFEDHETLRLLPKCCHVFHPDCVGIWLASHSTCPCCRADLLKQSPSNDVVVDVQMPQLKPART